jgi:hypothetical protein
VSGGPEKGVRERAKNEIEHGKGEIEHAKSEIGRAGFDREQVVYASTAIKNRASGGREGREGMKEVKTIISGDVAPRSANHTSRLSNFGGSDDWRTSQ